MRRTAIKCLACDCCLTDFEATRKYESGEYIDLCNHCLSESDFTDIPVIERDDLKNFDIIEEEVMIDD